MEQPRVGVACLVITDGQLLLGRREKSAEPVSWQLPGGFMKAGESVFEAANRLAWQKASITIQSLQPGPYTNNVFPDLGFHSVTLYVLARPASDQIGNKPAPGWQWFDLDNLPHPLFLPLQLLLDQQDDWLHSVGVIK